MIQREFVEIPPDKTLMPKLGLGGYSIPQAISELIDNAVDARVEGTRLQVEISFDVSSLRVKDDGIGMDAKTLRDAMRLAYSAKEGKLGEFGLGLKTACTSLGKQFDVRSSSAGDRQIYTIRYDEDEWIRGRQDKWILPLEKEDKPDPKAHGTTVTVRRLRSGRPGLSLACGAISRSDLPRTSLPGKLKSRSTRRSAHLLEWNSWKARARHSRSLCEEIEFTVGMGSSGMDHSVDSMDSTRTVVVG